MSSGRMPKSSASACVKKSVISQPSLQRSVSSSGAEISNTSTNPKVAVPALFLSIKSLGSVGLVSSVISV